MILGLSILVILHELGHFLAARAFGIRVEKFYLFFDAWGFKLFKFKKGDTEYGVGWLPLGGYVKITGMVDESLDTNQLASEPQPHEFRSKPAWQRLIVMVGGVVVNLILGIVIFAGILTYYGESFIPNDAVKNGIAVSELGEKVGFQNGDKLVAVNGQKLVRFEEIYDTKILLGDNITVQVERDGAMKDILLPDDFTRQLIDGDQKFFVSPRRKYTVAEVVSGEPADKAGLKAGDQIVTVNNAEVIYFDQLQTALKDNAGDSVTLNVNRAGSTIALASIVKKDGTLGFRPMLDTLATGTQKYSLLAAIPAGAKMGVKTISDQVKSFGKIFSGDIPVQKSLGGPIAIAQKMYGGEWVWYRFWTTTALLSLVLAFFNILPIPALDGGHVVFLIYEMITGRPASEKVLIGAQYVGMAILLSLMVFIFGNDIWQNIIK